MLPHFHTTIAAIATPLGRGGIGIIRISGQKVSEISRQVLHKSLKPRTATHSHFYAADGTVLDEGLALYFPAPHSFTGEDVLELHGHGGTVVLNTVLQRILQLGACLARPGEFSERAFLNNKLDLAQAEAIADLIDAGSTQAARAALRSLQGEFSKQIQTLTAGLINLRMYIEAAIDFPEEEIDFLADARIENDLKTLLSSLQKIYQTAKQGTLLREGMDVVIAGRPNAGKSSLLNALSGRDAAIVTEIPGTTRDILREFIQIDGMPLHIIDTAGLRVSTDQVEQEGIRRAQAAIADADRILLVVDGTMQQNWQTVIEEFALQDFVAQRLTVIVNKIDLLNEIPAYIVEKDIPIIKLSIKQNQGLDLLRDHLKACMGFGEVNDTTFTARQRHLEALIHAEQALARGLQQLTKFRAGELLAEELRLAQQALGKITGEFTSEDLLGKIFSTFCIGK